ncbi:MAG: glycosyltransferase family 4 protein [Beijerinckiaceae bacterium]
MRLAVLTSHPIQYYAPLFRHLARRVDLHVFYSHRPSSAEQSAAGFGVPFAWDVDLVSGYAHTFLENVSASPSVSRFHGCDTPDISARLSDGRFDAVLTLGWHLKSLVQGIWAAKRLGIPVLVRGDSQVLTQRSALKRWLKTLTYPGLLRAFDAALYVGVRNKAYYAHYGYPLHRLFHSPHCVDTDWFASMVSDCTREDYRRRIGVDRATKLLMFAGKLVPFKRPLDVVDAAAELRGRGIDSQVMVAGSGELDASMRAHASGCGVPLHMLGFQNQSQMPAAYAAADALVLPSTSRETWGLVCNEALACGTPVVICDAVGCAPDIAADGRVGRSYPLGDAKSCADRLNDLFCAPPTARQIADASGKFSIDAAAVGILEALSRVTAGH